MQKKPYEEPVMEHIDLSAILTSGTSQETGSENQGMGGVEEVGKDLP